MEETDATDEQTRLLELRKAEKNCIGKIECTNKVTN